MGNRAYRIARRFSGEVLFLCLALARVSTRTRGGQGEEGKGQQNAGPRNAKGPHGAGQV